MSNYTKTTNFATKDNLSPGNPLKIVKGAEIDTEFNNIQTAVATKTDNSAANITGGSITGITDLAVADGGTGASTAAAALNNLLPSQTSAANKYLQSDGTNASWDAVSLSTADITGTLAVANGGTGVTSSTGTGNVVLSNSPTLVTPALGTPASGTATNLTGLPISTGVSGLGTGVATFLATPSSANLISAVTDETGSGALVFATSPTLVTPVLGTPASGTLTNATGLPISTGVSGLGTGVATFLATPSSANLISAVTDETGTGALVFATSPTLVTPALGTPASGVATNLTGLPLSTGVTGTLPVANGGTGQTSYTDGQLLIGNSTGNTLTKATLTAGSNVTITNSAGGITIAASAGGTGDVVGPASSTDNALARFDTTTGKLLQNSVGLLSDTGAISGLTDISASGAVTLSGGTANGVTYLNGSKVLTSGSALTFDGNTLTAVNTSGNAIIASRGSKDLRLTGNYAGANTHAAISTTTGMALAFMDESNEYMRLTSTGLGIGTSSPGTKLTAVGGNAWSGNFYEVGRFTNSSLKGVVLGYDNTSYTATIGAYTDGTASNLSFWNYAGSGIALERMRLDSAGNLGLGATSITPRDSGSRTLELYGTTSGRAAIKFTNPTSGTGATDGMFLGYDENFNFGIVNNESGVITFGTSNTERARIDSSGNFIVGKTSTGSGAGISLEPAGVGSFNRNGATTIYANRNTSDGTVVEFLRAGSGVGSVSVTASATAYNTSSDYRLKNVTGALTGYKERLMSLLPKQGTWIVDGSEFRGFVAHDFANPYPKSVLGEKDAVDADGKPIMQSMQASSPEVMADLVAMVKDLVTENESLKARLDAANL